MSVFSGKQSLMLTCKCLNVTLVCESLPVQPSDTIFQHDQWDSNIFHDPNLVVLVNQDDGDKRRGKNDGLVSTVVSSLVVMVPCSSWNTYRCLNCCTTTHAISTKTGQHTLINLNELLDPDEQYNVRTADPDYCPAYDIVVYKTSPCKPAQGLLRGSFLQCLDDIHQKAKIFLTQEKNLMFERIEDFEEKQRQEFDFLQSKVERKKDLIEQKLRSVFWKRNEDTDSAYEKSIEEINDMSLHQQINSGSECSHEGKVSNPDGDLFEMDPFIDDEEQEENVFSDVSDTELPNYQQRSSQSVPVNEDMAKSMPINVPRFREQRKSYAFEGDIDQDDETTPDQDRMQASIRALAQSVGGDGTEMFGDLPRPRFQSHSRRFN